MFIVFSEYHVRCILNLHPFVNSTSDVDLHSGAILNLHPFVNSTSDVDLHSGAILDLHPFVNSTSERERNVLFNDALNTFYLRLYGVSHMPPHRLLLSINSKCSFICTIPQTG